MSAPPQNFSSSVASGGFQPSQPTASGNEKPVIIGLYGLPGCGKSYLLNQLREELDERDFAYFEGSIVISSLTQGGLQLFTALPEDEQRRVRERAIMKVRKQAVKKGKAAIVAGHFMFWKEGEAEGQVVVTQQDLQTYTHLVYLELPPHEIFRRRELDTSREREPCSVDHLQKWQEGEILQLQELCRLSGILFIRMAARGVPLETVAALLRDFRKHSEAYNTAYAETRLDDVLGTSMGQLETVLVLDADRTLAPDDSGAIFWKEVCAFQEPLKALFSSPLGYSYKAFRQAMLLYEEAANEGVFESCCQQVASTVKMYPEFVSFLKKVADHDHVGIIVATCGLKRPWDIVLEKQGLSSKVVVIGGGRLSDGFVVTAAVKAALVVRLQARQKYVWAFGDSPLDLGMLRQADQAIVVVGDEETRSKQMDSELLHALDSGLRARQVLLSTATPRLDEKRLPVVHFVEYACFDAIVARRHQTPGPRVLHATERSIAKQLMAPTRNNRVHGPALQEAHRRVGAYLSMEFLPSVIGLEEYAIEHVQGHLTRGHRLLHAQRTSIVALMRGGEPMAFGVFEILPHAMFVHANVPRDVKMDLLDGQETVILVDSVINSGQTIIDFVEHIRRLHPTIRIVIVAGVVQAKAVTKGSLAQAFERHVRLNVVALRLSENEYTGTGPTDTGNRLFNTTHL